MTVHFAYDRYVLLTFDGLYLLIPQEEVESVEIVSDVHHTRVTQGIVGWFNRHGYEPEIPIYCLSGDLHLLPEIPESREYFVLLKTTEHSLGILCDEVDSLSIKTLGLWIQAVPAIMQRPTSPIGGLVIYRELIAIVCHGTVLAQYLLDLAEHFDEITETE